MGQLHLVRQTSIMIVTFRRQHHSISSFIASAQKVAVLGMLYLVVHLERPPQGGSLDHLANMADTIGHRLLIYDHPYVPVIGVPSKQPQGSDE
jgi:hypothetical protein